jgi:uncharacterized protein (TIGR02284 family)
MADESISVLNRLIETCRNGQHGFHEAAETVRDAHLRSIFNDLSEQREQFAAQLRYQVSRLGGRPENRGTLAGVIHRRWIELRSTLSANSDRAVIAECERGEDIALAAYEAGLKSDLSDVVRTLIEEQHAQIKAARDLVRSIDVRLRRQHAF